MNEVTELARRYVSVWNETDPEQRRGLIRSLWSENGMECTKSRITQGYVALEARITASHEKNVREGHHRFLLRGSSERNGDVIKLDWQMIHVPDGRIKATGSYVLVLNEVDKIRGAYFFADP